MLGRMFTSLTYLDTIRLRLRDRQAPATLPTAGAQRPPFDADSALKAPVAKPACCRRVTLDSLSS